MTREIKFRAWDRVNEIYYPKIWNLGWKIGGIRFFWDDYKNSDGETMVTDLEDGKFDLVQYTGLKDKNGVEIYEGDLVRGYDYKKNAGEPRQVIWTHNGYSADGLSLWALNDCEVIGNIYENPELLKGEDNENN